jgi:membrane protein YdbS with pleckstrin-like domain
MNETENKSVSVGEWIITIIILAIPLVNIVMLIVWAANESTHPSKKNYAKAALIVIGVLFAIGILAGLLIPALTHALR